MKCRTPFRIYTLVGNYGPTVVAAAAGFPAIERVAQIRIPFNGAIVGYCLANSFVKALGGLDAYSLFIVIGQTSNPITISGSMATIGSQLTWLRSGGVDRNAQTDALFFKGAGFTFAANQPIAFYASKGVTTDAVFGVGSLYVIPTE